MKKMAICVSTASGSWKPLLLAAIESNAHLKHSTYFQLATVASSGRPANRTVVFRGFQEGTDKIQINTDIRTNKIEEIRHCPFGEICWYFTDTWEQFRIGGRIEIVDGSNADPAKLMQREKSWFASSLKSRFQYLGPAPRLPVVGEEPGKDNLLDQSTGPVDTFCLLVFDPDQIFFVQTAMSELIGLTMSQDTRDLSIINLSIIYGNEEMLVQREKSWFASSLKSRFQYLGPAPRLPVVGEEPGKDNLLDQPTGPVDTFCLLVFDPDQVDYLNLKRNERLMFNSRPTSEDCKIWMSEQINP